VPRRPPVPEDERARSRCSPTCPNGA
jgi:hypothetical protein